MIYSHKVFIDIAQSVKQNFNEICDKGTYVTFTEHLNENINALVANIFQFLGLY